LKKRAIRGNTHGYWRLKFKLFFTEVKIESTNLIAGHADVWLLAFFNNHIIADNSASWRGKEKLTDPM
jgi:hypothetical protein